MLDDRGQERLYVRHLRTNPQAAFVVDDLQVEPSWAPSGILVKGTARLHTEGGEVLGPGFVPNWVEMCPVGCRHGEWTPTLRISPWPREK
ncbi:hypothetical protein [Streptomyces sp. V4I2]|uniref:hypothetical protein n=1 Tax=Streptomyces sp. V4I2 TaxID=3042280 RepID=UPI00278838AA|nr:hypothetical protein [Streptomyces sp. V4I2]MDQ1051267.1 hypothetical protein [Streptomyces sp. V4I2]